MRTVSLSCNHNRSYIELARRLRSSLPSSVASKKKLSQHCLCKKISKQEVPVWIVWTEPFCLVLSPGGYKTFVWLCLVLSPGVVVIWLWVKKGQLKNPIGKRENRPKPAVPRGFLFDPQPFLLQVFSSPKPCSIRFRRFVCGVGQLEGLPGFTVSRWHARPCSQPASLYIIPKENRTSIPGECGSMKWTFWDPFDSYVEISRF